MRDCLERTPALARHPEATGSASAPAGPRDRGQRQTTATPRWGRLPCRSHPRVPWDTDPASTRPAPARLRRPTFASGRAGGGGRGADRPTARPRRRSDTNARAHNETAARSANPPRTARIYSWHRCTTATHQAAPPDTRRCHRCNRWRRSGNAQPQGGDNGIERRAGAASRCAAPRTPESDLSGSAPYAH